MSTSHGDTLSPSGQVGPEPVQGGVTESDGGVEAVEEDGVINGVKSCSEVQEDEEGGGAIVRCSEDVVGDPDQCCFGTVSGAETRLEFFGDVVAVEVVLQLGGDYFFQHLGEEW